MVLYQVSEFGGEFVEFVFSQLLGIDAAQAGDDSIMLFWLEIADLLNEVCPALG